MIRFPNNSFSDSCWFLNGKLRSTKVFSVNHVKHMTLLIFSAQINTTAGGWCFHSLILSNTKTQVWTTIPFVSWDVWLFLSMFLLTDQQIKRKTFICKVCRTKWMELIRELISKKQMTSILGVLMTLNWNLFSLQSWEHWTSLHT